MSLRKQHVSTTNTTTDPNSIITLEASDSSQYIIATTREWKVTFLFHLFGHEFKLNEIEAVRQTDGISTGQKLSWWHNFQVVLTPGLHTFDPKPNYINMMSKARVLEKLQNCSILLVKT